MEKAARPKTHRKGYGGVHSSLYNPVQEPLTSIDMPGQLSACFSTMAIQPQFVQLWPNVPQVTTLSESSFGLVPVGSVLSYQQSRNLVTTGDFVLYDAPPVPHFPLPDLPATFCHVMDRHETDYYKGLEVGYELSQIFQESSKLQAQSQMWHSLRQGRLTASTFKRICSRRKDFEALADGFITAKDINTRATRHGIAHEDEAARVYSTTYMRNNYLSGFVINPSAYHLGCSPDRIVHDPDKSEFGLLEIKCPDKDNYLQCTYLHQVGNDIRLRKSNLYYDQIMGQLGITGLSWCDFFVYCCDDHYMERIYYDHQYFLDMKTKLDHFYFMYYLPAVIRSNR